MYVSPKPKTVFTLVQASVYTLAVRLFVLTDGRRGSKKYQPTIATFFETGIVTSLYEHMLMSPTLANMEIRHEMPYPGDLYRPKQVDLWMRPWNGGYPHLIEAGDYSVSKIHSDLRKITALNTHGANWFLAFFRNQEKLQMETPAETITTSFKRSNGLDSARIDWDERLTDVFDVYRPNGEHDRFGVALLKAK